MRERDRAKLGETNYGPATCEVKIIRLVNGKRTRTVLSSQVLTRQQIMEVVLLPDQEMCIRLVVEPGSGP